MKQKTLEDLDKFCSTVYGVAAQDPWYLDKVSLCRTMIHEKMYASADKIFEQLQNFARVNSKRKS